MPPTARPSRSASIYMVCSYRIVHVIIKSVEYAYSNPSCAMNKGGIYLRFQFINLTFNPYGTNVENRVSS